MSPQVAFYMSAGHQTWALMLVPQALSWAISSVRVSHGLALVCEQSKLTPLKSISSLPSVVLTITVDITRKPFKYWAPGKFTEIGTIFFKILVSLYTLYLWQ